MSTTSIRTPRQDPPRESLPGAARSAFEARWRNPERALVDYLSAAWVRKFWVGLVVLVAGGIATLYALLQPNSYASHASVLVFGNRTGSNAADLAANMLRVGNVGPSQVMSALEVVNSHEVAHKVVGNLGPAEIMRPYQPRRATEQERERMGIVDMITDAMHLVQASWFQANADSSRVRHDVAAEVFRRSFAAWADERASMIKLYYRAGSPELAQRILDEVVKVAVERYRQVTAPAESREWVQQRTQQTQRAFDEAKGAHEQFMATHGRVRFGEDIQARARSLSTSQATHDAKARELESTTKALATFTEMLKDMPDRIERNVNVSAEPGETLSQLLLRKFELEQDKLNMEAGRSSEQLQTDPKYGALVQSLTLAERRIVEVQQPQVRTIVLENPEYRVLDERVRQLRLAKTQLEAELPGLRNDLEAEKADLARFYALQDQADRIVDQYTVAKAESERWKAAKDSIELASQLERLGLSSLQLVDAPTMPLEKEGPQRGRLILLGMALGLFGALSWILIQVRLSRSFLRTSDVVVALGRSDVVGMPWLDRGNVERYHTARKRGWD